MSYCLITGKIYFKSILSYDTMTEVSYFLLEKAILNRIGLNINSCLTELALYKYPADDYLKYGYIPYEIVDTPWSGECHKIFEGIGYTDKTYKIDSIDQSRLPDVQKFLYDIIGNKQISYIILELEDIHLWPREFTEYEINANKFCQTILDSPNQNCNMPTLRLKIIK